MNDGHLKAALERQEEAYEGLLQARASLGTMLAETIRKGRDLAEFTQHMRDLPLLIWRADVRRTELKIELLTRRLKKAEEEHRRDLESARRTAAALEEAKRAHMQATNAERRSGLQVRRLKELHQEELARLERLRSEKAGQEEKEEEEPSPPAEETPPGTREYAVTPTLQPGRTEPRPTTRGAQEGAEQVSWWRRVFGT
jgi:hypothetical protein